MESGFGFGSPRTAQPLVLLQSSRAGCGSGSAPAAAHPDVGVWFQPSAMGCPFLWVLYLNINWAQKSFIVLVIWVDMSTFSSELRKCMFRFQLVCALICKVVSGN